MQLEDHLSFVGGCFTGLELEEAAPPGVLDLFASAVKGNINRFYKTDYRPVQHVSQRNIQFVRIFGISHTKIKLRKEKKKN